MNKEELKQKNNNMKTYEVTRQELQVIYPNVCKDWQAEINKVASVNPIADVIQVDEELIKRAYDEANGDQKKWLNKVFPEFFPKLVVGNWYAVHNANYAEPLIAFFTGVGNQGIGKNFIGKWSTHISLYAQDLGAKTFEATEEQVLEALTKEAKRRGLIEGVRVDFEVHKDDIRTLRGEYELNLSSGWFSIGTDILFHFKNGFEGIWNDKIVKEPEIDYSRLKTGSKVRIKYTGQFCNGTEGLSYNNPVDIVFYKTPHRIDHDAEFELSGAEGSYVTFHQNGKYIVFSSATKVDYITEVIEY